MALAILLLVRRPPPKGGPLRSELPRSTHTPGQVLAEPLRPDDSPSRLAVSSADRTEANSSSGARIVDVRVSLADGRSARAARVTVKGVGFEETRNTNSSGEVGFQVPAERWPPTTVYVIPVEADHEWKRIHTMERAKQLAENEPLLIDAILQEGGLIEVEVSTGSGASLAGHCVRAIHESGSAETWYNRIEFCGAMATATFNGLISGKWKVECPEWRNFGKVSTIVTLTGREHSRVLLQVDARDDNEYSSGRFTDLAGEVAGDGFLRDYRLERKDGRGDILIYEDGAFFVFDPPLAVRVKQLSRFRSSYWIDLIPGMHIGDLPVPW